MRKIKLQVVIAVLFSAHVSADILSVHCPVGCPGNKDGNDLIFRHLYALSNNPDTKFADWVAYEVNVLNFGPTTNRTWIVDPLLDEDETLEKDDYKKANAEIKIDRGHQAPLASFVGSRYWPEMNHLSNITPQHQNLNQGAWANLEQAVRDAVGFRKSLFVITGPLYSTSFPSLPGADESHQVPGGYYKIVYDKKGRAQGFIMEQSIPRNMNYCDKTIPIQEIEDNLEYSLPAFYDNDTIKKRLGC